MKIWSTALLLGALCLGGCGGGGSGGDGSSGSLAVSLSSTSVNFTGVVGGASGLQASQPQIDVTLKNGSGTYYASASSDSPYVTARFTTQSDTNGVIFFSMIGNPPPGHHGGSVTFVVCGNSSCSNILATTQIPFTYDLYGFSNTQLSLTAAPGGSVVTGVASIVPAPGAGVFSVTSDSTWLSGSLTGGTLTVSANPVSLGQGTYFGNLRLKSGLGEIDLAITLQVGNAASTSAQTLVVASDSTIGSLTRSVSVSFPAVDQDEYYTLASSVNWLVVPGYSVQATQPFTFYVDPAQLPLAPTGTTASANIYVNLPGAPQITIPVTVTLDLANIYQVSSRPLLAGITGQSIEIHGKGFGALTSASPFQIPGFGSVAAYTDLISDTDAVISIPFAPTAGAYLIEATNASPTPSSAAFAVTPATSLPSIAVPVTAGTNSQILYDAVRSSVLNLDLQNGQFSEYAYANGTWNTVQCSFPGVAGMTISPDQRSVYIGDNANQVYNYGAGGTSGCPGAPAIDAAQAASGLLPAHFFAETYDNRVWLARSSTANYYFDLSASSFGSVALGGTTGVTVGSSDGSLVIGSQSNGSGLVYSAAAQAVSTVSNTPSFSNGSFSPYHDLLLADYVTVYSVGQTAMSMTGFVAVEPGFTNYGAVISADGSRVYVLEGDPTTTIIDHVSVYDSTSNTGVAFNLLGQIALPTKASDCTGIPSCSAAGQLTADPNGRNLYWVGNRYMIVIPVTSASGLLPVENKFRVAHIPKRP